MAKEPKQTSFSNLFPKIEYDFGDGIEILDIWSAYEVITKYKGSYEYYETYAVPEGQRLDNISYVFYETPDLWWFILLYNDEILDPFTAFEPDTELDVKTIKMIKRQYLSEILYAIRQQKIENEDNG